MNLNIKNLEESLETFGNTVGRLQGEVDILQKQQNE